MAAGGYLDIAGLPTWVAGDTSEGALVLMHGTFDESDGLLGALGPHLNLPHFAYDRSGRGRTRDHGQPYRFAAFADHAAGLFRELGGPRTLVGYSEGGILAQYLALRHSDVVSSLVLIASVYSLAGATPPYMRPGNPFYDWAKGVYAERSPHQWWHGLLRDHRSQLRHRAGDGGQLTAIVAQARQSRLSAGFPCPPHTHRTCAVSPSW